MDSMIRSIARSMSLSSMGSVRLESLGDKNDAAESGSDIPRFRRIWAFNGEMPVSSASRDTSGEGGSNLQILSFIILKTALSNPLPFLYPLAYLPQWYQTRFPPLLS